jgi:hypothetical protein
MSSPVATGKDGSAMDPRGWIDAIRRALEERRARSAIARRLDVYVRGAAATGRGRRLVLR